MSVQENKIVNMRFFEEIWNEGKQDAITELLSPDYVCHDPFVPGEIHGRESFAEYVTQFRTAFPDMHFTIADQIAEDDLIATRWSARGTFTGPLMGMPPTGTSGEVTGITIMRCADGKSVESWIARDDLGMLKAMGVVPEMAAAAV